MRLKLIGQQEEKIGYQGIKTQKKNGLPATKLPREMLRIVSQNVAEIFPEPFKRELNEPVGPIVDGVKLMVKHPLKSIKMLYDLASGNWRKNYGA